MIHGGLGMQMRIPIRAARFNLHGERQKLMRLAEVVVQGPATKAGRGPDAWACRGHLHWGHLHLLCPPHKKQCRINRFQSACLT